MKQYTFYISDELYEKIRIDSLDNETSCSQIIRTILKKYYKKQESKKIEHIMA